MFIELTRPRGDKIVINVNHIVSYQPSEKGYGTFMITTDSGDPGGKIVQEMPSRVTELIQEAMKQGF